MIVGRMRELRLVFSTLPARSLIAMIVGRLRQKAGTMEVEADH